MPVPAISRTAQTSFAGALRLLAIDRPQLAQGRAERLAVLEHRLEQVAVLLQPQQYLPHAEVARPHLLAELLPPQRRRDRRAALRPHGVHGGDRLPVSVLPVVDEHASALLL